MIKRLFFSTVCFLLSAALPAYPEAKIDGEVIADYKEGSIVLLNDELRKIREDLITVRDSVTTFTPSTSNALSGSVIQTVTVSSSTSSNLGNTALPFDTSRPQNTEGNAATALNATITPTNSNNKLVYTATVNAGANVGAVTAVAMALFKDSDADALKVVVSHADTGSNIDSFALTYTATAGSTSATTFKLRLGTAGGDTVYLNGTGGGSAFFGASCVSTVVLQEIKA